jgi:hypothetical protein
MAVLTFTNDFYQQNRRIRHGKTYFFENNNTGCSRFGNTWAGSGTIGENAADRHDHTG